MVMSHLLSRRAAQCYKLGSSWSCCGWFEWCSRLALPTENHNTVWLASNLAVQGKEAGVKEALRLNFYINGFYITSEQLLDGFNRHYQPSVHFPLISAISKSQQHPKKFFYQYKRSKPYTACSNHARMVNWKIPPVLKLQPQWSFLHFRRKTLELNNWLAEVRERPLMTLSHLTCVQISIL